MRVSCELTSCSSSAPIRIYWTKTGHTGRAAEDVAATLREAGAEVDMINLREAEAPSLDTYELVVIGSPCHAGSVPGAGSGIAPKLATWLSNLPDGALHGKRCAGFVVHSSLGGARTLASIEKLLRAKGADIAAPGVVVKAGVPFSLWVGPKASEEDREKLRKLGATLAAESE